MIVKQVIRDELLTLPEVKEVLTGIRKERENEGKELGYELRKAIAHAEMFSRLPPEKSRELANELMKLEKMKPDIAFRIANIAPRSRDELRAIYAKEKFSLSGEELDEILELVKSNL